MPKVTVTVRASHTAHAAVAATTTSTTVTKVRWHQPKCFIVTAVVVYVTWNFSFIELCLFVGIITHNVCHTVDQNWATLQVVWLLKSTRRRLCDRSVCHSFCHSVNRITDKNLTLVEGHPLPVPASFGQCRFPRLPVILFTEWQTMLSQDVCFRKMMCRHSWLRPRARSVFNANLYGLSTMAKYKV